MEKRENISDFFGCNVFNEAAMRTYLSEEAYRELRQTIDNREVLKPETAKEVAEAMKKWAIAKGATHYSHWFQPMNNSTAEKHDSFISAPKKGKVLMDFSYKELLKSEPDASSFPSGGLRATFEARGYTAWDCTSPAFIKEEAAGTILCIPTAFCSYTGEALDKKTPLLRSMQVLDRETVRMLRLLGNQKVQHAIPSVGAEQEYFLVDRQKYLQRQDMVLSGRTLFGAPAAKGQEMDDHYFGTIRERVGAFMSELNEELWRMGVPGKTQHNEVAPSQHELASIYAEANIATDQNQIVMDTLKRLAYRHGLHCLLHEKPYATVNGSGKHDNWSLVTDEGVNLLDPGKTPHDNLQFLLVFTAILKAVDRHADLLRASTACPGNDQRLGAQEAPPAIISVYIGDQMEDVLEQFIENGSATHSLKGHHLKTGVTTLPNFRKDATDRNRTSPFAFTGNKFEFRMVGSSDSVACANTILNSIVAEAFSEISDELEKSSDVMVTVQELIGRYAAEHRRIVFNGNGYSEEWKQEAERRGLPNLSCAVEAIRALEDPDNQAMMERLGVFSPVELEARAEVRYETYVKTSRIEGRVMVDMAERQILPAAMSYLKEITDLLVSARGCGVPFSLVTEEDLAVKLSGLINELKSATEKLRTQLQKAEKISGLSKEAEFFHEKVVPAMAAVRKPADALELIVRKELWPFPTYQDLMFEV